MAIRMSIRVLGKKGRVLLWEGDGHEIVVGRSAEADLALPDPKVSGLHLVLRHDASAGVYLVRDERSLNGTRLNGRSLGQAEQPISPGDRLALGGILLTIEACSPPGEPAGPPLPPQELSSRLEELLRERRRRARITARIAALRHAAPAALDVLILLVGLAAAVLLAWVVAGCRPAP